MRVFRSFGGIYLYGILVFVLLVVVVALGLYSSELDEQIKVVYEAVPEISVLNNTLHQQHEEIAKELENSRSMLIAHRVFLNKLDEHTKKMNLRLEGLVEKPGENTQHEIELIFNDTLQYPLGPESMRAVRSDIKSRSKERALYDILWC